MSENVPIPSDALTLTDATLLPHSGGELAAGSIRVTYTVGEAEVTYEIEYDTKIGPDGLFMAVTDSAGDMVVTWAEDEREYAEVPQKAIEHAKHVLSVKHHEAKTNKPPQTGVCFAGIVPLDDDEIAEIAG